MKLFDPNNPNEKKKVIAAAVLGIAAIAVLGYAFFGGSSKTAANKNVAPRPSPGDAAKVGKPTPEPSEDPSIFQPIGGTNPVVAGSEANRNIFAFYEPPPPPIKVVTPVPPSPTPTPPLTVSSLAPSNVYALTADFTLQVTGDKFTPAVHIVIDGRDLPTRFINSQQLFTTVPASVIANPGTRTVVARTPDGKLYSDSVILNVTPPPLPNFNFVGIIGKPRFNDKAVLQDKSSKELVDVQRGEIVGGRFRVSSISEREIVLIDTTLNIRHRIQFTVDNTLNPSFRPPARVSDEEPNL